MVESLYTELMFCYTIYLDRSSSSGWQGPLISVIVDHTICNGYVITRLNLNSTWPPQGNFHFFSCCICNIDVFEGGRGAVNLNLTDAVLLEINTCFNGTRAQYAPSIIYTLHIWKRTIQFLKLGRLTEWYKNKACDMILVHGYA